MANTAAVAEVKECLRVGANVRDVSSCISEVGEYEAIRDVSFHWNWIVDYCGDSAAKNCSDHELQSRLTIKKGSTFATADVAEPTVLFRSKKGGIGGPFVMLYVFYRVSDGTVIGWSNVGTTLYEIDFRTPK
ncbi:MAG TPA: hypothetical protein VIU93_13985 [Gallionellaceae bacterium]